MSQALLTVIGEDRPGIVAAVTQALHTADCAIGDASMMRLGGYFTIMQIIHYSRDLGAVETALDPAMKALNLRIHLDPISSAPAAADEPNVRVTVYGADHAGIVASVTQALASVRFNIVELESEQSGNPERPIYVMVIQGSAPGGIAEVREVLEPLKSREAIEIGVHPIDTALF
ncbi:MULTISPECIES: glycine cleavage system transcriptional repressor [Acidithiobacillus]|jgi:glycine cleavage system transcriptional repressor|uniref:Glycine cleavage system transcriptional antiactivator GcvR n=3 Tax=Acidithiobacillus caldus TaxID=33059 RepID=F9ZS96_ACICS|nr:MULTISPECIES: ACT domain-containing protein [Acidithiobacillus]AEK59075.1 Glycine cleavage system transcriptional antiactivator GcvR [Acidithiobacillus caldus SM-1]AIA56119.1 Glycine cleavage system transcriptional antiactivator GcvR [Acidithiobacillus caldus ATCC 51756]AUW33468.1 amino acid-binding protein [Acidithiobacillus caldus]MBU2730523.1 amino acid-binding protein [Acidithiobacillus caldus]MBU2735482.1 amino acid-binding protein [Acidithiobacillus caldus ATCC 51756]